MRTFRHVVLAALALVILMAPSLASLGSQAQSGVYPPPTVALSPTGVYGLLAGDLDSYTVDYAVPDYSRGVVYVTGRAPLGAGFIAAVNLDGSVAWSLTLEGAGVLLDVDDPSNSKWLVAISQLGDVIVIDLDNPGFYAYYYRAVRGEPVQLDAYRAEDGSLRVTVHDGLGVIYVFTPPTPYWLEVGPDTGEAPGTYVSGIQVGLTAAIGEPRRSGDSTVEPRVFAILGGLDRSLYATLYAQVFYEVNGTLEPARAGNWTYDVTDPETETTYTVEEVRSLRLWLVDIYYRSPETLSGNVYPLVINESDTGEVLLENVFPASFYAYIEYEVFVRNLSAPDTPIISYSCYNAFERVDFTLAGILYKTFILQLTDANTSIQCDLIRNTTYVIEVPGVSLMPVSVVDYTDAPSSADVRISYLPLDEAGLEPGQVVSVHLVKPTIRPLDWVILGISYIAVFSTDSYAHIIFLNDRLEAVSLAGIGYGESIFTASRVTALLASTDATKLYMGTESGKLYELTWGADGTRRYVATGSLQVSPGGAAITSVSFAGGSLVLAATADGYAQLVDTSTWTPLWRGIAVYQGLAVAEAAGIGQATVGGLWAFPEGGLAGYFTGTTTLLLPQQQGYVGPLYPVYIDVNVTVAGLEGGVYQLQVESGSYVEVYVGQSRLVMPLDSQGNAVVFLPPGDAMVRANVSAGGSNWLAEWSVTVSDTVNYSNVTIALREAVILVSTPGELGPGYQLVAGPKEGALVTLEPEEVSGGLPYTPMPGPVSGYTGPDGLATFIIYEGVSYSVNATLEGYTVDNTSLAASGPVQATLAAHPELHPVSFNFIDAEVYEYTGIEYVVPGANVTIQLIETGMSVTLAAPEGSLTTALPAGNYTITAVAAHYRPAQAQLAVSGASEVTIPLDPERYTIIIEAFIDDYTGMVSGPAALVRVQVTPMNLPLPPITVYTDLQGRAVVEARWALYNITLSHPMLFPVEVHVEVVGPETLRFAVEPRYAALNIEVVDSELAAYGILAEDATVTLTYTGPFVGGSKTVALPEGRGTVIVPFGYYTVTAVAPGYYESLAVPLAATQAIIETSIPLQPIRYPVTFYVYFGDDLWNLAVGPVPGAVVTVSLAEPELPLTPSTLITGRDGSATFTLRAGVYEVRVSHPLLSNFTTLVRVAGQATYTLQVPPYYINVTLKVLDAETLEPVPGVTATITYLSGSSPRQITVHIESGVFEAPLPAGEYRIELSEPHYADGIVSLNLGAAEETQLSIALQPLYQVVELRVASSEVSLEAGFLPSIPISGARVTLTPADPVLMAVGVEPVSVETGPEGVVLLTVRVGSYNLEVEADHFNGIERPLEVAAGARIALTINLDPILYTITLTAYDPDLIEPYSTMINGTVRIVLWNGNQVNLEYRLVDGTAELVLPAGFFEGFITAPGYFDTPFNLSVPASESAIELEPITYLVTIEAALTSDFGFSPAAGVPLILVANIPLREPLINATISPEGSVTLQLRPGSYRVLFQAFGYTEPYEAGELTVTGPATVSFEVPAPLYNLTLAAVDAEFTSFTVPSNATLTYLGPYGSGELTVSLANGSATLQLPAGTYQVVATAPFYGAGRLLFNLTNTTTASVTLTPVSVRVEIIVQDIDGNPVPGALVELRHDTVPYVKRVVAVYSEGVSIARVPEGVRQGGYTITVFPPEEFYYLQPYRAEATIVGQTRLVITLEPVNYNVTILLVDSDTGDAIEFPYVMKLQRVGEGSEALLIPAEINVTGATTVTLPYGTYSATLEPAGKDYYIIPPQVSFVVDGPKNVTITLQAKQFPLSVIVNDDRGNALPGALVQILDDTGNLKAAGRTDADGYFTATLRYGTYIVKVTMEGYREATRAVSVPDVPSLTVDLQPGPIVLLKRFTPLIIGAAGLGAALYLVMRLRERIAERLAEEEYF